MFDEFLLIPELYSNNMLKMCLLEYCSAGSLWNRKEAKSLFLNHKKYSDLAILFTALEIYLFSLVLSLLGGRYRKTDLVWVIPTWCCLAKKRLCFSNTAREHLLFTYSVEAEIVSVTSAWIFSWDMKPQCSKKPPQVLIFPLWI